MAATCKFAHLRTLRLPSIFNKQLIDKVHQHWFPELAQGASAPTKECVAVWWGLGRSAEDKKALDDRLRNDFSEALDALSPVNYPLPAMASHSHDRTNAGIISTPFRRLDILKATDAEEMVRSGLGLVILLDQFARNIFREQKGQAMVYGHYDRLARALSYSILGMSESQQDEDGLADLTGVLKVDSIAKSVARRSWLYLPLMHSEDKQNHEDYIRLVSKFKKEVDDRGDEGGSEYLTRNLAFEDAHKAIIDQYGRYPYRNDCLGREATAAEKKYMREGGERFSA